MCIVSIALVMFHCVLLSEKVVAVCEVVVVVEEEEVVSRNIMVATAGLQLTQCQVSAAL